MRVLALALLLPACAVIREDHRPLEGESTAITIGPQDGNAGRPKFFMGDTVAQEALSELAPYHGLEMVLNGHRSPEKCAHFVIERLIDSRPDAILVFPGATKVTGVNNHFVFVPYAGWFTFASASSQTGVVGFALRATRCRLPFEIDRNSGFVRSIFDSASAPGLIEGDTITKLSGCDARLPQDWPTWSFYSTWLNLKPGDTIDIEWIRPSKGKMTGTAMMLPPLRVHIEEPDGIETKWMRPLIETTHEDGRVTWELNGDNWTDPRKWEEADRQLGF